VRKEIDFGLEFRRGRELAGFHGGKHATVFFAQFARKLLSQIKKKLKIRFFGIFFFFF
jgi:hypothetical protein